MDETPVRITRRRLFAFLGVVAGAVGVAVAGFVRAIRNERGYDANPNPQPTSQDLAPVLAAPHVLFRDTQLGPTFSLLAAVPLAEPSGPRVFAGMAVERVHSRAGTTICLQADRGIVTTYHGKILDASLRPVRDIAVNGLPKPARISADGTLAAWTVLIAGTGCTDITMEVESNVEDLVTGESYGAIEKTFTVLVDGKPMSQVVINVWDVSFENVPRPTMFYVTISNNSGTATWLAKGDLPSRTITSFHTGGQTPSLSPDNKTLVFVQKQDGGRSFRLRAIDLASGDEWYLPEQRSVDDQVEWLDNEHVLYSRIRDDSVSTDVWISPLRDGQPRVFIEHASSPAVVS